MDRLKTITDWLVQKGRVSDGNATMLSGFCEQLVALGVPLARCWLHIRTLHPNFAGMSRLWTRGEPIVSRPLPYGFETTRGFLDSPVHISVQQPGFFYWRLDQPTEPDLPRFHELRAEGYTGYAITQLLFSDGEVNSISWATDVPDGFSPEDLALFEALMPTLSAVVEVNSLRRFAGVILTTYVGREPAELIFKGQVRRGEVRSASAALMLVDLRDFTALSDTHNPAWVIETLNRYFDCVIPPVLDRGGDVMEIMGDAILAVFTENGTRDAQAVCRLAYDAANEALGALARSNAAEMAEGVALRAGIALHHGQASYGNIGAGGRLDFTVIGPDVNLTSRIERLCRDIGRDLIMTAPFADLLDEPSFAIGHFDLRGFARKQLLYGLIPT